MLDAWKERGMERGGKERGGKARGGKERGGKARGKRDKLVLYSKSQYLLKFPVMKIANNM